MNKALIIYVCLFVTTLVMALVFGPHSCEGGLNTYFWYGIVALIVSGLLPFFAKTLNPGRKVLFSFLLIILFVLTWVGGFGLGNFKIMCRLF